MIEELAGLSQAYLDGELTDWEYYRQILVVLLQSENVKADGLTTLASLLTLKKI